MSNLLMHYLLEMNPCPTAKIPLLNSNDTELICCTKITIQMWGLNCADIKYVLSGWPRPEFGAQNAKMLYMLDCVIGGTEN